MGKRLTVDGQTSTRPQRAAFPLTARRTKLTLRSAVLCVFTVTLTLAAAPADASTRCSYSEADGLEVDGFPSVQNLRAAGTSCGIAQQVAFEIRDSWERDEHLPRRVRAAPRHIYTCSYKPRAVAGEDGDVYMRATCRRGRARRVTMDLHS